MAENIIKLRVESTEYDNKIKRARQGIIALEDSYRKVGRSFTEATKEEIAFVGALGKMETVSKSAKGKIAELTASFTDLSVRYNRMTEQEKASPFGRNMSKSLEQLRTRIREGNAELRNINGSLNDNGSVIDQLSQKYLGISGGAMTKFTIASAAVSAALKVGKDLFFQSESNIDEWGRSLEGAKGAYNAFLDTLNSGNWSNFFTNLENAINGSRELYDKLNRLGSVKSNNQVAIAIAQKALADARLKLQEAQNKGDKGKVKEIQDQIKVQEEKLSRLRNQEVQAGKEAGVSQVATQLMSSANATSGNALTKASAEFMAKKLMEGGQDAFDLYARNYQRLLKKGTKVETNYNYDDFGNATKITSEVFRLERLTKEQQRQFAIAKAITERETAFKDGFSTYAQAINTSAQSSQETFKFNRQAGMGGSGGKTTEVSPAGSIGYFTKLAQDAQKAINNATTDGARDAAQKLYDEYQAKIKMLKEDMDARKALRNGDAGVSVVPEIAPNLVEKLNIPQAKNEIIELEEELKTLQGLQSLNIIDEEQLARIDELTAKLKEAKAAIPLTPAEQAKKDADENAKAWSNASRAIGAAGSALQSIEDPGAKVMGTIAMAIANIAGTFASSLKGSFTPWDWIAGAAAGTATMISTIAAIKSATAGSYANGGVVGGSSYYGDKLYARVNSGEAILNNNQSKRALEMMDSGGGVRLDSTNLHLSAEIGAESLRFIMNSNGKRTGRGEIAYSH